MATDTNAERVEPKASYPSRWAAAIVLLLLALGDAGYLLYNHVQFVRTGQTGGGLCDINATLNCSGTLTSGWSSVAGVPLAVFAIAFLFGLVALHLRAGPTRRHGGAADLLLVLNAGGVLFSVFLLAVMVFTLDGLCPACLVLDLCQILLLIVLWTMTPGGLIGAARRVLGSFGDTVVGTPGVLFAGLFAVAFLAANFTYASLARQVSGDPADFAANPYARAEGYPQRFDVYDPDSPLHGTLGAPIRIIEFSDFECPHCARLRHTLEQLSAEHPGQIALQFRHYPLDDSCNPRLGGPFHQSACAAAQAAICAQEQGQFWPMHDALFDNQRHLGADDIRAMAEGLDLDLGAWTACIAHPSTLERIHNDIEAGVQLNRDAGLDSVGTPFFTVNGVLFRGGLPLAELEAIVQAELAGGSEGSGAESSP